ncbi:hypothetical protein EON65_21065 [archaeon]|nr:MAG: hypothetical protein EON65_21065 [archaeon]
MSESHAQPTPYEAEKHMRSPQFIPDPHSKENLQRRHDEYDEAEKKFKEVKEREQRHMEKDKEKRDSDKKEKRKK